MAKTLSSVQREARSRADAALKDAREIDRSIPLSRWARANHTTVRTIRRYFPGATERSSRGTIVASPADRATRTRLLVVEDKVDFVKIRGSRRTSKAELVWQAQQRFAKDPSGANEAALRRFRGTRIGGREVTTDPGTILEQVPAVEPEDIAERYKELLG